jgi:hypothetical protein
MNGRRGLVHVRVSRSAWRGSGGGLLMNGTCGRSSFVLSASAGLQSFLENKLRARLSGSQVCEVTWCPWTTPWRQSLSRPRARVRSTFATDTGLWPTIRASDGAHGGPNMSFGAGGTPLPAMAAWATWPTPTSLAPAKNGNNEAGNSAGLVAIRKHAIGLSARTEKRGALNPEFVCWLMGFPPEWLSCAPSETPSSRRSRRGSLKSCARRGARRSR